MVVIMKNKKKDYVHAALYTTDLDIILA